MSFRPDTKHYLLLAILLLLPPTVSAEEQKHRTGKFTAVFTERSRLSTPAAIKRRMHWPPVKNSRDKDYELADETFEVYVPQSYTPDAPFGLIVWVSPSEKGRAPEVWQHLMDKHKLIWVGANKSGNKHSYPSRRIPLALDAAHNTQKLYSIDPNRVYVAGLSGGGRVASITAFHHSDVYAGGIFVIGANYWKRTKVPGKKRAAWYAGGPKPKPKYLARARRLGRYVFLTGDTDENRLQMHTYYEKAYKKMLKNCLYLQVPQMGHTRPPVEWFEKAIQFLDDPTIKIDPNNLPTSRVHNRKSCRQNCKKWKGRFEKN